MAELVARAGDGSERWRRTLPEGAVTLGRRAERSAWGAPWDPEISGRHARLTWRDGRLTVVRDPAARNPIFYRGRAVDVCTLGPGEHFVIGRTTFVLEASPLSERPEPDSRLSLTRQQLRSVIYADPSERLDVLASLPDLIRGAASEEELQARVLDVLLRGVPRATEAALVRCEGPEQAHILRGRAHGGGEVRPSRRLLEEAILRQRQSVLHVWRPGAALTATPTADWALCVPVPEGPTPTGGLYLAGQSGRSFEAELLKSDLKFTELVADVFGALHQVRELERRQALLGRFLPPPVLEAIAGRADDTVLRPREATVTVLFCDLRGSCGLVEEGRGDLPRLWERVSAALQLMSSAIVDEDGVVSDIQGDSVMGFWGWPLPCADGVERAGRAALAIQARLARLASDATGPLAGFGCGIGIAHGPAIAGLLGTPERGKVDVFGPTVNLAARLESMTRLFGVSILLDEASAARLSDGAVAGARCRRVARVVPFGMQTTVQMISEFYDREQGEGPRPAYEAALDAFLAGRWEEAARQLAALSGDGPSNFLRDYLGRQGPSPPPGWSGVIPLTGK